MYPWSRDMYPKSGNVLLDTLYYGGAFNPLMPDHGSYII